MTSIFMFSAYPTIFQSLGFLTINNLLGLCFAVLLVARVLDQRDLSFLRVPQVLVLVGIGLLLLASSMHADAVFPLLDEVRRSCVGGCVGGRIRDRTAELAYDFGVRLVFLVFILVFVRSRADIRMIFLAFVVSLYLAVPSALLNWVQGNLSRGFRAAASVTVGSNPNRLAMICLIQVACWWFWARMSRGTWRSLVAGGAIASSLFVLLLTGSRSGLMGAAVLAILMQTGPRRFRVRTLHLGAIALAGVLVVLTVVPADVWQRATNFLPERHSTGASSSLKREATLVTGLQMIQDQPVFGIGLGNFREVARQIYKDRFFRPPHNSYLWAAAEGGLVVLGAYLFLFWLTWRDLRETLRLAQRDHDLANMAAAMRVVFLLYTFFAFFADMWLNPITYIMIGLIFCMRRCVEALPAPATTVVRVPRRAPAYAFVR
jgi:O-antigen ligase